MKLRVLSEQDCRQLLSMEEAIEIQAEAFSILAAGKTAAGLRSFATSENPPGVAIFNPCFLTDGSGYGFKVVSDFYDNPSRGVPRMTSLVALMNGQTGAPSTVMEGGYLTDLRTGAGTGLAVRYLARADSSVLTIIGAGRVARNQIEAITTVADITSIRISTRTAARGEQLIAQLRGTSDRIPDDIRLVESAEEAVRDSDIVVASTTAHTPVVKGEWLRSGTLVASVGSYAHDMRELDSEVIRRSAAHIIDSRTECLTDAGDFQIPAAEGVLDLDDVAEIAEVVSGKRPGRRNDDEIIVYKSIGVPVQDLITGQHIDRKAHEQGLGVVLDIGGDHD